MELSKDTYKTTVHLDKSNPTLKPTSKPTSKLTKSTIMKTKHPFKEIKGRLHELQSYMHNPRLPLEKIKTFIKDKAVKAFQDLHHHVQNGIYWLHKNGYWKPIANLAKTVAKPTLVPLCSKYIHSGLCEPAVGFILDHLIK